MTLRELRQSRGLTLEALALEINCNLTTLSKFEVGESKISKKYYIKLCQFFNVDTIEPLGYKFIFDKAEISTIIQALNELNKQIGLEILKNCNYDINEASAIYNEALSVQMYESMKGVINNEEK